MTNKWDVITVTAAVGCGAVGGVFFAFSALVMSGLTRLPAAHGLEAMKSINITAVRPPLMLALFGTAALCVVLAVRAISTWGDRRATLLLAGALLYLLGAIVLTIAYNVPLNNHLATLSAHAPGAAAQWHSYAQNWTIANHIRAAAGLGATALLALALLASRSPQPGAGHSGARTAPAHQPSSLPWPDHTPGATASARGGATVTFTVR
ncbi:MAG: anthrone oxygenase family protein [Actinomycetota bacterium]